MKTKSMLLAAILAAATQGAFASLPPANEVSDEAQVTNEQVQKGLAALIEEGIIEWKDGRFVVKDQNALDQLRSRGRVDMQVAAEHVICY
ncbi:MAG: hypothetical protein KF865_03420 [Bdellovibrionaceae bacterium]|nr:hypothetical protein [Pseudobdellovibrionaceae bacterium]